MTGMDIFMNKLFNLSTDNVFHELIQFNHKQDFVHQYYMSVCEPNIEFMNGYLFRYEHQMFMTRTLQRPQNAGAPRTEPSGFRLLKH